MSPDIGDAKKPSDLTSAEEESSSSPTRPSAEEGQPEVEGAASHRFAADAATFPTPPSSPLYCGSFTSDMLYSSPEDVDYDDNTENYRTGYGNVDDSHENLMDEPISISQQAANPTMLPQADEVRAPPMTRILHPPTIAYEQPPAIPYEQPPTTAYEQRPAIPYEQPPTTAYEQPPAIPYEQLFTTAYEQPPAIPYEKLFTTAYEQPLSTAYEQPPAFPYEQPPTTAYEQPPATPYEQPPTTAYEQPPTTAYEQPPASPYEQPPTTADEQSPTTPYEIPSMVFQRTGLPQSPPNQSQQSRHQTGGKEKRFPSAFTSGQLLSLENKYKKQKYLNRTERVNFSRKLKLTERQVKLWFQYRRRKQYISDEKEQDEKGASYQRRYSSEGSDSSRFTSTMSPTDFINLHSRFSGMNRNPIFRSASSQQLPSYDGASTSQYHPPPPSRTTEQTIGMSDEMPNETSVTQQSGTSGVQQTDASEQVNLPSATNVEQVVMDSMSTQDDSESSTEE